MIACCTRRSTSWRSPAAGLGDRDTPHRLWLVAAVQQAGDRSLAVRGDPGARGFNGHPRPHPARRSPLPACRPGSGSRRHSPLPSGVALRLVPDLMPCVLEAPRARLRSGAAFPVGVVAQRRSERLVEEVPLVRTALLPLHAPQPSPGRLLVLNSALCPVVWATTASAEIARGTFRLACATSGWSKGRHPEPRSVWRAHARCGRRFRFWRIQLVGFSRGPMHFDCRWVEFSVARQVE